MFAVRSKTGKPFRRSGVTFAPDQWKLLEALTPEQEAEPALLIIADVTPGDTRLGPLSVDATEVDGAEDVAQVDVAALIEENAELKATVEAFTDRIALLEGELAKHAEKAKK